jgi:hypothetical protein
MKSIAHMIADDARLGSTPGVSDTTPSGWSVLDALLRTPRCVPPAPSMFARRACGGAGNGSAPGGASTGRKDPR